MPRTVDARIEVLRRFPVSSQERIERPLGLLALECLRDAFASQNFVKFDGLDCQVAAFNPEFDASCELTGVLVRIHQV